MIKGTDQKYNLYIEVDGARLDLIEDLTYLQVEIFDKRDNLIEQFKYPAESGFTTLQIVTDVDYANRVYEQTKVAVQNDTAVINVDGNSSLNARKGALKLVRTYGVSDAGFSDGSYDKVDVLEAFDILTNE